MSLAFDSLKDWWSTRTQRERWMLAGMGALIVALLFWYGLLRPLQGLSAEAKDRHAVAIATLTEAQALKAGIDAAGAGPATLDDLAGLARAAAAEAAIGLVREEPGAAGSIELWTEPVEARTLFAWLSVLQAKGVGVRALETHRGEDGLVEARLALGGSTP
jgi:general secretion pathway protein M